jgi:hypothetical protein
MPRKKEDGRKVLTMKLVSQISGQSGKSAIELEKIFFRKIKIEPAGSRWNRYKRGERAMSVSDIAKISAKAVEIGLLRRPSGFLSYEDASNFKELDMLKEQLFLANQKNKAAMKIVANARSAIRAVINLMANNHDYTSSIDDKYWQSKRSLSEDLEVEVDTHEFDYYTLMSDVNKAEKLLAGIRFDIDAEVLHKASTLGLDAST